MNIFSILVGTFVSWLALAQCLVPFYARTLGASALPELQRFAAFTVLFSLILWAVLWALLECQALLAEAWPVVQSAWYHRFRPNVACPDWDCARCWEARGVVLGCSRLSQGADK